MNLGEYTKDELQSIVAVNKAKEYASRLHSSVNHKYDDKPYSYHLQMVFDIAKDNIHHVRQEYWTHVLAACWGHDLIEDCRVTYNDVRKELGYEAAEIIYALTNEKGKNRSQRANDKYYQGIIATPYAPFVKVCDRIANFDYSIHTGSSMAEKYSKEMDEFLSHFSEIPYLKTMTDKLASMNAKFTSEKIFNDLYDEEGGLTFNNDLLVPEGRYISEETAIKLINKLSK